MAENFYSGLARGLEKGQQMSLQREEAEIRRDEATRRSAMDMERMDISRAQESRQSRLQGLQIDKLDREQANEIGYEQDRKALYEGFLAPEVRQVVDPATGAVRQEQVPPNLSDSMRWRDFIAKDVELRVKHNKVTPTEIAQTQTMVQEMDRMGILGEVGKLLSGDRSVMPMIAQKTGLDSMKIVSEPGEGGFETRYIVGAKDGNPVKISLNELDFALNLGGKLAELGKRDLETRKAALSLDSETALASQRRASADASRATAEYARARASNPAVGQRVGKSEVDELIKNDGFTIPIAADEFGKPVSVKDPSAFSMMKRLTGSVLAGNPDMPEIDAYHLAREAFAGINQRAVDRLIKNPEMVERKKGRDGKEVIIPRWSQRDFEAARTAVERDFAAYSAKKNAGEAGGAK